MKKLIIGLFLFLNTSASRGDLFGGDVAVLTQILAQAIAQLSQLKELMGNAEESLDLVRQINQGINDSLNLLHVIDPNLDPGIYRNWTHVGDAVGQLQRIYGIAVPSPEQRVQKDMDRGIAEAITFNNSYYDYTKKLDQLGEEIKSASHSVSPGGASKLTAQSLGVIIQVLNQNLRAQATALKLHAQELAVQNRKEKAETKLFLDSSNSLKRAMQTEKIKFELPEY